VLTTEELQVHVASERVATAPGGRIARLLWESNGPLGLNTSLAREVGDARRDYERFFGAWNPATAYGEGLQFAPP
jgi:hypothetical protein